MVNTKSAKSVAEELDQELHLPEEVKILDRLSEHMWPAFMGAIGLPQATKIVSITGGDSRSPLAVLRA